MCPFKILVKTVLHPLFICDKVTFKIDNHEFKLDATSDYYKNIIMSPSKG